MTSARVQILQVMVASLLLAVSVPALAKAQDEGIVSSPKGTVGAGLLGAELGLALPAAFGMDAMWPYIVFPAVGAVGGATLGLLVIDKDGTDPKIGVAVLAAGAVAAIPVLVLTLSATAYDPESDAMDDDDDAVQFAGRVAGPGLLRVSPRGTFVGAPAVKIWPGGGQQAAAVEVPVVSGLF